MKTVLENIVPAWVKGIHTARKIWEQRPHLYHEVLYEKLQQSPQATLHNILNDLGADSSTPIITSCMEGASFAKLSGGRKKGQEDTSSHFRKGIIGDWKNHLDKTSVRKVTLPAQALFEEFGYE